jgi:hypothetical protein
VTCSQIWLIPLVDDPECGDITNLENKKFKEKTLLVDSKKKEKSN